MHHIVFIRDLSNYSFALYFPLTHLSLYMFESRRGRSDEYSLLGRNAKEKVKIKVKVYHTSLQIF